MKSIHDILTEMDGSTTPLNTTGMGNPMPPTETQPGSEPFCPTCKKKKKKVVKESVLDNNFDANADDLVKIQWVKDNSINWDPALDNQLHIEDGLIYFDNLIRLRITGDMPDGIQFGNVYIIDYALVKGCPKNVKINLPKEATEVTITNFTAADIDSVKISADKKSWIERMTFNGSIKHIDFPKDLKVNWLYMRDLSNLELENMSFPVCSRLELSRKAAENYLVKKLKIHALKEFTLS